MSAKGTNPLEYYVDFMGNKIVVGDTVMAVRVPDRTPQFYTGEIVEIRENYGWNSKPFVQIKVLPTGGYSTSWAHHGDYTNKVVKASWIKAENVIKYPI